MEESVKYFRQWEKKVKDGVFDPSKWQRKQVQLNHPDRRWLSMNAEQPVLDVGCGSAVDSTIFEQHVGLDVTPSFIRAAKEHGACNLILGDARHLPIREKSVATSYCKDLLLHLPFKDAISVIRELLRVGRHTFVAWGFGFDKGNRQVYTPILRDRNEVEMKADFWHNKFSRKKLNLHCTVGQVIQGTSITEVREK